MSQSWYESGQEESSDEKAGYAKQVEAPEWQIIISMAQLRWYRIEWQLFFSFLESIADGSREKCK